MHFAAEGGHTELVLRLLGLGADPRLYNRRGKTAEFIANETLHFECTAVMKKNASKVYNLLTHKTSDSFFVSLKVAGISDYFGILGLEGHCHDMRVLCDKVVMTSKKLKNLGFFPAESRRIDRICKNKDLGRSLKLELVENDILSAYKVLVMRGNRFSFDLLQIDEDILKQLSETDSSKLKSLQAKISEEFHLNDNKEKHSIEKFWATAQIDSSLTELGDAIRDMKRMDELEHDFNPVRPEAPSPKDSVRNASPRQERFRVKYNHTGFLAAGDINVKDMVHIHNDM